MAITEINYNPVDPTTAELAAIAGLTADDFEFVEIKNVGSQDANLLGTNFNGFTTTLGSEVLAPGEYGVIAHNPAAFALRYGSDIRIVGEFFDGTLSNGGESIRMLDPFGNVLVDVSYDDSSLWPQSADGSGTTLELRNPDSTAAENLGKYYSWQASVEYGGSPGRAGVARPGIVINEILANTSAEGASDGIELLNISDSSIDISGWWLSDAR